MQPILHHHVFAPKMFANQSSVRGRRRVFRLMVVFLAGCGLVRVVLIRLCRRR